MRSSRLPTRFERLQARGAGSRGRSSAQWRRGWSSHIRASTIPQREYATIQNTTNIPSGSRPKTAQARDFSRRWRTTSDGITVRAVIIRYAANCRMSVCAIVALLRARTPGEQHSTGGDGRVVLGNSLRRPRPADLPAVQRSRTELKTNLRNARALGLAVPPSLLCRAADAIE